MQKFILSLKPWQKILINALVFLFTSIISVLFLLCLAALLISNVDTPEHILIPLTTVLLVLASFLDSFFLAKIFKEKGLYIGACVGAIISTFVVAISAYYGNFAVTGILFTKILSVLFAGISGGILGVNNI